MAQALRETTTPELLTVPLANLLVDPGRFSTRAQPIDEDHLQGLIESLAAGELLPPLRAARIEDAHREWSGCAGLHTQRALALWGLRERETPWSRLPLAPDLVVYDGLTRYWAHHAAGATTVEVLVDADVVIDPIEVLARHIEANLRNGRNLTPSDLRRGFERLWLGREPRDAYEQFKPGPGALPLGEIARLMNRTPSWATGMVAWCEVCYALRPLSLPKTGAVQWARLDRGAWRTHAYLGEGPRPYPVIDERGAPTATTKTIFEMSAREIERLVDSLLGQERVPLPDVGAAFTTPSDDAGGQFAFAWDDFDFQAPRIDRLAELRGYVGQLAPQQAYEWAGRLAPAVSTITKTYTALKARAAEGGYVYGDEG